MAENTDAALASVNEVLAYAGLTADDLPGVDVESFISDEQLTVQLLQLLDAEIVKNALLGQIVPVTTSCEYLLTVPILPLAENESVTVDQILRIAVVSSNDALIPSLLIDLNAGLAYYSSGYFFYNIDSASKITELTDDMRVSINTAVENAGIETWQSSYVDSEETLASQNDSYLERAANWIIAFETADGVIRYEVFGIDTGAPESFFALGVHLYQMFW